MEIALDPPEGGGGRVNGLGSGLFEVADPDGHGIGDEQRSHEQAIEIVEEPHRPRGDEEEDRPGDHGGQGDEGTSSAPGGEKAGWKTTRTAPDSASPPWFEMPQRG